MRPTGNRGRSTPCSRMWKCPPDSFAESIPTIPCVARRRQNPRPAAASRVSIRLARQATAEAVGTALLVAIVVGSGIFAQRLSPDDVGLQLLENSTATALGLVA